MQYTNLGRTGLRVSQLCLGTMNFGPETSEEDSHAIMDDAHEVGINFFDTANVYGGARQDRGDHRSLVRPGRRTPREDRARHQALRRHGRLAERREALGAEHPPGRGRLAEAAADRLHRPLPDAPRRPEHAVGRDLGGHGVSFVSRARSSTSARRTSPAGTSPRRRRRPRTGTSSAWSASSRSTTWRTAGSSSRSCPAAEHYGLGVIPWSPLPVACSVAPSRSRRPAPASRSTSEQAAKGLEKNRDAARGLREALRRPRRGPGQRRAGLAADPAGGRRRRSSVRAPSSS